MKTIFLVLAAYLATAFAPAAQAAELKATPATIAATLKAAQPGDVIKLSGGPWGYQNWGAVVKAEPGVTIEPAAGETIVFGGMRLAGAEGLTLRGIDYTAQGQQVILVTSSKRIAIEDCNISAGNTTTDGIWYRWSSDVTARRCKFRNVRSAIFHQDPTKLLIEDFDISEVYSDGIRGGANGDGITIQRGTITNQHLVGGDHLDGIQFWTTGATKPTTNVLVQDVVVTRGSGSPQQCLLVGNEKNLPYTGLVIRGFACVGGLYNGINVSGAVDYLIEDSYVQPMAGAKDANGKVVDKSWIGSRGSTGGVIRNSFATLVNNYQNASNPKVEGFTAVPIAAAGDYSGLEAWLKRKAPPADPKAAEIATLRDQLATKVSQVAALEARATSAEAGLTTTSAELKAARAEAAALQADLAAATARLGRVAQALKE